MPNYYDTDLKKMVMINVFEKTLLQLFAEGKIRGTTHTSIGQEYIPVAVLPFMENNDFVISNHRGHGHYLALTGDQEGLLCEIIGKEGAVCHCYGGSQQLYSGNFMTLGVQGENVSIATGIAWSFKHEKKKNISYVYIGDGTLGRGSVYESLNIASVNKLPLVIIIENNEIAMTTPISNNLAGSIEKRARAFDVDYVHIEGHNLDEIRKALSEPIQLVREKCRPLVIEFVTQRLSAHSKGDDTRSEEKINKIKEDSWYYQLLNEEPERLKLFEEEAKDKIGSILETIIQKPIEGALLYEK